MALHLVAKKGVSTFGIKRLGDISIIGIMIAVTMIPITRPICRYNHDWFEQTCQTLDTIFHLEIIGIAHFGVSMFSSRFRFLPNADHSDNKREGILQDFLEDPR